MHIDVDSKPGWKVLHLSAELATHGKDHALVVRVEVFVDLDYDEGEDGEGGEEGDEAAAVGGLGEVGGQLLEDVQHADLLAERHPNKLRDIITMAASH